MSTLPTLGAALKVGDLERFAAFLRERPRDLELQDFMSAQVLNEDWRDRVARARTLLDGHEGRLGIHGPFVGFSIAATDPDIRPIVSHRMLQALDACEALGATHMVIHSPFTTWSYHNLPRMPGHEQKLIEVCHETLRDAVRRAEAIGCMLVIENIEDIDPLSRVRLADSFESDAVAVSLDTGHAHYAHGRTGAPPVDYYVRAAGNRLHHVHVQDADGYGDRHWAIGKGNVLWPSVFEAVGGLESNPRLILELADPAGLEQSVRYLEALGLAQ